MSELDHNSARRVLDRINHSAIIERLTSARQAPRLRVGWLCYAWGESDKPVARLATSREDLQAFIVDEWLGNANDPDLPGIMAEVDGHDWSDEPLEWTFEIGGVRIERLYFPAR